MKPIKPTLKNDLTINTKKTKSYLLYQTTVGALQYDDYKGPNRQYVEQDKLIICISSRK